MKTKKNPYLLILLLVTVLFAFGCPGKKLMFAKATMPDHEDSGPSMMIEGDKAAADRTYLDEMMTMIQKCSAIQKETMDCDRQIMIKCQKNMTLQDCSQMMTEAKQKLNSSTQ